MITVDKDILLIFPEESVHKSQPVYATATPAKTIEHKPNTDNGTSSSSDDVIIVDDGSPSIVANGEPPPRKHATLREMLAGIPGFSLKVNFYSVLSMVGHHGPVVQNFVTLKSSLKTSTR